MEANDNCLMLDETEFVGLKQKDQMLCLYKNQVATLKAVQSYKIHLKIQYAAILLLFTAVGFLIQAGLK